MALCSRVILLQTEFVDKCQSKNAKRSSIVLISSSMEITPCFYVPGENVNLGQILHSIAIDYYCFWLIFRLYCQRFVCGVVIKMASKQRTNIIERR